LRRYANSGEINFKVEDKEAKMEDLADAMETARSIVSTA
jgi:hypothetical protein